MRLYHEIRGCSLAVDIVARELSIPLDLIWVDVPRKLLPDGSDYYRVNPKGQVPALELADGQHLTEGPVIMQYLADQVPGTSLLAPAGTLERYRILEWMSFFASNLHKGGFMPLFRKATPMEYRKTARDLVESRMGLLHEHLAGRTYLTGDTFTIADAHGYTIAMWTKYHDIDISRWPELERYLERIGMRPSVKAAEQAEREEIKAQARARSLSRSTS